MSLSPFHVTLASGAHAAATTETYDVLTRGHRGIIVIYDVTAAAGAFSTTLQLLGLDTPTGVSWNLLQGSAITGTGASVYDVHPTITAIANVSAAALLPDTVRVSITHTDATSITRTIAAQLVD